MHSNTREASELWHHKTLVSVGRVHSRQQRLCVAVLLELQDYSVPYRNRDRIPFHERGI